MRKLIYRYRFARRLFKRGADWQTAWYCAGQWIIGFGMELNPIDAADEELSYWSD
jgi:hypothetical protein